MIQKTTKIICDNCGQGIYDFPEDLSYRQVAETCKEKNIAVIRYKVGKRMPYTFCDEKCCKEWEDKNEMWIHEDMPQECLKTRKAKSCFRCPAEGIFDYESGARYCLLGYEREEQVIFVNGVTVYKYLPKECCHKPKTTKEFLKRLKEK